jgi:hypothetical protein
LYRKSGRLLELRAPRISLAGQPLEQATDLEFSIEGFKIQERYPVARLPFFEKAVDTIDVWASILKQEQRRRELAPVEDSALKFARCIRHMLAKVHSRTAKAITPKVEAHSDYVFACSLTGAQSRLDGRIAGFCWCVTGVYKDNDLAVLASIVDPLFTPTVVSDVSVRGTGRALKQGVINFMEQSAEYDYVTSMAINRVSSYINETLGFVVFDPASQEGRP